MKFGSTFFIFISLPIMLVLYYIVPARFRTARNVLLLLFSYIFYAFGNPLGLMVLIISTECGYFFARAIEAAKRKNHFPAARRICRLGVYVQIAIFLLFEYLPELLLATGAVHEESLLATAFFFPMGLALYTLQMMSILADICQKETHLDKGRMSFTLTVAFFPKIFGGPLVSYSDFSRQIRERKESLALFGEGAWRLLVGLSKKIILADAMAAVWNQIAGQETSSLSALTAWTGFLSLSFYLYFEFSGYSDMANGLGKMFGFALPENFRYPYQAENMRELFRRWQMTITAVFRRGASHLITGNANQETLASLRFLAFGILFGLWHGAKGSSLLFGIYTGFVLALDQLLLGGVLQNLPKIIKRILTFLTAGVGWILLMMPTPAAAFSFLGAMVGGGSGFRDAFGAYSLRQSLLLLIVMAVGSTPLGKNVKEYLLEKTGKAGQILLLITAVLLFAAATAGLVSEASHPFLQFPLR